MADNIHAVVDDIAGMRHPLPADHELVFGIVAEGIGHATVPTAQPDPALDRIQQPFFLIIRNRPHCPDRHNQVKFAKFLRVQKNIQSICQLCAVPFCLEAGGEYPGRQLWLVAIPPTHYE